MKRFRASLGQQGFQHHVLARRPFAKMLAIGLTQRANACVAVLLIDAASRVTIPAVQTPPGHLALPKYWSKRTTPIDKGYHADTGTCSGGNHWLFRRTNLTQGNGPNDKR